MSSGSRIDAAANQHVVFSPRTRFFASIAFLTLALFAYPQSPKAQGVDLDAVFNCSEGGPLGTQTPEECLQARELVLGNCTACHTFVPIVKAQKDDGAWNATLNPHRSRLQELSDEEYEMISVFLKAHYNPDNTPPVLPPELENLADIPQ